MWIRHLNEVVKPRKMSAYQRKVKMFIVTQISVVPFLIIPFDILASAVYLLIRKCSSE